MLTDSGIVTVDISDHLPVFCMVDTLLKKQNRQNMYFRDYSKFNTESYLHDIHTIDWNAITEQRNDLHEVTARTIDAIELFAEKHAPKRKRSRTQQRLFKKPWLTRGIIKSIKSTTLCIKPIFFLMIQSKQLNSKDIQIISSTSLRILVRKHI